jgi:hypothetical protein
MPSIDFDLDDYQEEFFDDLSDGQLIDELEMRGYSVESRKDKCPTDHWKDEYIAQAYNELNWEEWRDMIEAKLAEKKGGKK